MAEKYGTPFLLYELDVVRANCWRIRQALTEALSSSVITAYAYKACYLPAVLSTVRDLGWAVEVMSAFELDAVLRSNVDPERVILTGLGWTFESYRRAVELGVRRFVLDSWSDMETLAATTTPARPLDVLLRANLPLSETPSFIGPSSKLGLDRRELEAVAARAGESQRLRVTGIHMHQVNRSIDPETFGRHCAELAAAVMRLRSLGHPVVEVDLGGGLESLTRLQAAGVDVEAFARQAARHLDGVAGLRSITVELGRAVVGDAAVAVGRVRTVKPRHGACVVVVDVPTNTLIPIPGAHYPPVLLSADAERRPAGRCSVSDGTGSPVWLAEHVHMSQPAIGDLLGLYEAGAYTTVFGELWAAALPTVIVRDGHTDWIRPGADLTRTTWDAWYGSGAFTVR